MIPKKIHYCWFGGQDIPPILQKYMASWDILLREGYEFYRWDENNCSFNENDFVKLAYREKRWGFISDYYRLKSLFEHGGIYLDTDVLVSNTFDDLLDNNAFIGYMFECALGTAVIGAEKGSKFIKCIKDMYDNNEFSTCDSVLHGAIECNEYKLGNWVPNNEFFTWRVIKEYPEIRLDNSFQKFDDFTLYPMNRFDAGNAFGKEYCRHMYSNLWRYSIGKNSIKNTLKTNQVFKTIITMITPLKRKHAQKSTSFYTHKKEIKNRQNSLQMVNNSNNKLK